MKKSLLTFGVVFCVLGGASLAQGQINYEPYLFTSFAGSTSVSSSVRFNYPAGVAVDGVSNVYVADTSNHTIRKINGNGAATTLAGLPGTSGTADGIGNAARFNFPQGVAADSAGNLYVADTYNHTIRKITVDGRVSTMAGLPGSSGSADGTGEAARFDYPQGIAVDNSGNVYVADTGNNTVRKIASTGIVSTLAGSAGRIGSVDGAGPAARFTQPQGIAVDSVSNVYVSNTLSHTIRKINPAGVVSTLAGSATQSGSTDGMGGTARFNGPQGIAADGGRNVYVADTNNHTIRKITPDGFVTTLAGWAHSTGSADGNNNAARFNGPESVTVDSGGNVYVADSGNNTIRKITPGGFVSTLSGLANTRGSTDGNVSAPRFDHPKGVALDSAGNVYVADTTNNTIDKITPTGVVNSLAGSAGTIGDVDGAGSAAQFNRPEGVAVDSAGNVYVADTGNFIIRKITPSGVVTTLAGDSHYIGSDDGVGRAARFHSPAGVAVDNAGNVYVGDTGNHTIRKITPNGTVTTLAGLADSPGKIDGTGSNARFNQPEGVAVDTEGNIYVADFFNFAIRRITPAGVVKTLIDSTGNVARFDLPSGVAIDGAGIIYVTELFNFTIRKLTPAGLVSILAGLTGNSGSADGHGGAARFNYPSGVAVDTAGYIYVADTDNNTVRKITPAGDVSTLAGVAGNSGGIDGVGSAARFALPNGVALDSGGNLYVVDSSNNTIRKISPARVVSTLAGLAGNSGSADGTGSAARFSFPNGVGVDKMGNVYVADTNNSTIRKITPAGTVITLAGLAGSFGSADGAGSTARFNGPSGGSLGVDSSGNVYIGDTINHTIRKITSSGIVSTLAGLAGSEGSADGVGSAARFRFPHGIAVDMADNLYVADWGNNTIRKINSAGVVSTLAGLAGSSNGDADGAGNSARFTSPGAIAVDSAGNVFVVENFLYSSTIRKVTPSGVVSTLGGLEISYGNVDGLGSAARFKSPNGIAVDSAGNLYVGDSNNNAIRFGMPPPFINSPLIAIGTVGLQFIYQFQADGATSLAAGNLPPGLNFIPALGVIAGNPTSAGTFPVTLSASNANRTTRATLMITIQNPPTSGPVIISTTSVTGRTGRPFQLQAITSGGDPSTRLDATGLPPGLSVDPMTGIISGIATADGSSTVTLTVSDATSSNSATLQLSFTSDPMLPVIVSPGAATLIPTQSFSYTIAAPVNSDPSDPTTFALIGSLPPGLTFDPTTGTISGTFTGNSSHDERTPEPALSGGIISNVQLFATNRRGTGTIPLVFYLAPIGTVNISTRLAIGTDDNVLIGGFIVTGNSFKRLAIRAIGPSLKVDGIPISGKLQDPILELHYDGGVLGQNDNWRESQEQEIIDTTIPPTDDREAAIIATLIPGNYTAIVRGKDNSTGIAVVEVYDLGTASLDKSSKAQLAQISTRGTVLSDDNVIIGGFIVSGVATKVIMRAIGPELNGIVPGALQDTLLELHDGSGSLIFANDDWKTTQQQQIIETGVAPKDDRESAIVATLNPGNYTAIVRGKGTATGVALVEVYSLQ